MKQKKICQIYVIEKYPYALFKFVKFCLHCCVWCWISTRKCQISDYKETRIVHFLCPLPTVVGGRLWNLSQENVQVFYKNQNIMYEPEAFICRYPQMYSAHSPQFVGTVLKELTLQEEVQTKVFYDFIFLKKEL